MLNTAVSGSTTVMLLTSPPYFWLAPIMSVPISDLLTAMPLLSLTL